jgi:cobalt-zinc-cadmium efflux system protein
VKRNINAAFRAGVIINIVFIIVEALFGFLSNSMALLSDAGHNLTDVMALIISWIAITISNRKPTLKFTYGLRRSTILAALVNTILLLATLIFIFWETLTRIGKPVEINAFQVIVIASIGIIVNGATAILFSRSGKGDLNIRSTFLHFLSDAIVSLGVVVAGILIALTGIPWIDSVVSLAIAAVIIYSTYHLLVDSVNLALDAVPEHIDIADVSRFLHDLPEVTGIHDLHIWAISTTDAALTVHLSTKAQTDLDFIKEIRKNLQSRFGIGHATIQVEYNSGGSEGEKPDCNDY